MTSPILLLVTLSVSIFAGSAAAILAWREGSKPGARPLSLLLVGQVWWSISSFFRIQASTVDVKLIWLMVLWVGVVAIPLGWFLFAIEYTGRDQYLKTRYLAGLATIPIFTIVLVATSPFHNLFSVVAAGFTPTGVLRFEYEGIWYWVVAVYTYVLGTGGVILLLELIMSRAFTFRKQAMALLLGLIVPWTTNLLFLFGIFDIGIDPTPIAFSATGVLYLLALKRFQLLKASPAPNKRARRLVFDGVREGAIVVDTEDHVVEINEPALTIFDLKRNEILGSPATKTIPHFDAFPDAGVLQNYLTFETETGSRGFEVEVTQITTGGGKSLGRLITLNEITDFLRQQQRLEVLNRVLRHNIRTETNLILGYAEEMEGPEADIVRKRALRIDKFGQKGREAIDLFSKARREPDSRNLDTLLTGCISDVREAFPTVTIEYDGSDQDVEVGSLLLPVFANAIENAAQHNDVKDPEIAVQARVENEMVHVEVIDNGPGISEYELSVLSKSLETPLEHGSGLGLWIIKWGTDLVGGSVDFESAEKEGTTVHFAIPRIQPVEGAR